MGSLHATLLLNYKDLFEAGSDALLDITDRQSEVAQQLLLTVYPVNYVSCFHMPGQMRPRYRELLRILRSYPRIESLTGRAHNVRALAGENVPVNDLNQYVACAGLLQTGQLALVFLPEQAGDIYLSRTQIKQLGRMAETSIVLIRPNGDQEFLSL